MMTYRTLGRTGVQVSRLCFGTMSFGGDADEATSAAMYKACRDAGINFFDTADQYNKGKSEEILGGFIKGHREELVIATKCFNPMGEDLNARGNSRHARGRGEPQAPRHRPRRNPLPAPVRQARADRRADARARGHGALGQGALPRGQQLVGLADAEGARVQERNNWARLQVLQPMYNLVKRQAEVEILPMALANGISVIPYSPGAAGLLSGKYSGAASGRIKTNKMYELRYGEKFMFESAERFVAFCKQRGLHPVSAAVAWVGAHPAVTAPIIGARNLDQLKDSLAAIKVEMTPALYAEIAALSPTPPPATDRLEEQKSK
jgi:aryl-alcohol dehydrogenase-like predicted oxidoreductase